MNFFKKLFGKPEQQIIPRTSESLPKIDLPPIKETVLADQQQKKQHILFTIDERKKIIETLAARELNATTSNHSLDELGQDPLLNDAAKLIVQNQIGSPSLLQRRMKLGYNRAGRLMDQLEAIGVVGQNLGSKAREVLIKNDTDLNNLFNRGINGLSEKELELFTHDFRTEIDEVKHQLIKEEEERLRQIQQEKINREKEAIKRQLLEKERKKNLEREALKELIEQGAISNTYSSPEGRREPIPQDIMDAVWNRDGARCVKCGSNENLEFDHIIPFSKGGATSYRNLQLLCKKCNIDKSNKIG